ncbi:hypothetical protein [Massilia sp. erpn]|uniref:hypothetical protein n=1 Tax=Massilia sp. erpn TaxID=2738142 RepID=UPI00210406AF|nr:hypothetical protein [Massilia sp. erpn]UTY58465.1 hypothetical protein HPQ68_15465 [Massilia sp. erpn]
MTSCDKLVLAGAACVDLLAVLASSTAMAAPPDPLPIGAPGYSSVYTRDKRDWKSTFEVNSERAQPDEFGMQAGPPPGGYTVRLAATLTHSLPRDWQLRATVNGQYTSEAPSEQQLYGAPATRALRIYSSREVLTDSGLAGNLELHSPNLCGGYLRNECRALMFYDRTYFSRVREVHGVLRTGWVRSVGVGLRMKMTRHTDLQLDYGRVLGNSAVGPEDRNRINLRLGFSF